MSNNEMDNANLQFLHKFIKENKEFDNVVDLFDDTFLLQFLRGKKNDMKKACDYLKNYVRVRTVKYADFIATLRPSSTPLFDHGLMRVLKHSDKLGRVVVLNRVQCWDPAMFDSDQGIRTMVLIADEVLRSLQAACEEGVVIIYDFNGYTFEHAKQVSPGLVLKGVNLLLNNMPTRYKAFHFINHGHLINLLMMGVRPFLKKKLRNRIILHSCTGSLHEYVPPQILPMSLDGHLTNEETFDVALEQRVHDNEGYYEEFASRIQNTSS